MSFTFSTTLRQAEGKNATGIRVPAEVITALAGGKKPKLVVVVNGYTYRTTIGGYGEVFMLPFSAEHREASGINAGTPIEVTVSLDVEPRTVDVPEDLALALHTAELTAKFDASSYSVRKEFVRQVNDAKTQDTRTKRIAVVIAKLTG